MPLPRPVPAMNSLTEGPVHKARGTTHAHTHLWSQPHVTHMSTPMTDAYKITVLPSLCP